jgi:hypothetical protein
MCACCRRMIQISCKARIQRNNKQTFGGGGCARASQMTPHRSLVCGKVALIRWAWKRLEPIGPQKPTHPLPPPPHHHHPLSSSP